MIQSLDGMQRGEKNMNITIEESNEREIYTKVLIKGQKLRNWNKLLKNNLLNLKKQRESDEDERSISLQTHLPLSTMS